MIEVEAGSGRFVQTEPFGPYTMEVIITTPEPRRVTYAGGGPTPVRSQPSSRMLMPGPHGPRTHDPAMGRG